MAERNWGDDFESIANEKSKAISNEAERRKAFTEAFREAALAHAKSIGIQVDPARKPTPDEIEATDALSAKIREKLDGLETLRKDDSPSGSKAFKYPIVKAAEDVAHVVGKFKNVDWRTVAASDELDGPKYYFDPSEKETVAILLDDFYMSAGYAMAAQIQPFETKPAKYISNFIAVVVQHDPHKR